MSQLPKLQHKNQSAKQVKEIIACGRDPTYFINEYVKIENIAKGAGIVPFTTFPFQNKCIEDFIEYRFNIVIKSRQLGLSTLTAAYALWLTIFSRSKNVLIIATKIETAMNFMRKVKTMTNNLPKWLILPTITVDNKQSIEFSNGSRIKAIPTSPDAGRSESLSLLIVDEAAYIRNFEELWSGLYPTLSTGGRAIVISTPNGVGDYYYELYTKAEAGHNEFNAIKVMWYEHPDRDQVWFDNETKNMNPRQIASELLCDFAAAGQTMISPDIIEKFSKLVKPPIDRLGFDSNFWIWEYPLSASKYIISADIARGDSFDFSTAHILDLSTGFVVAEYQGKIPPDTFAELLAEFGQKYNQALICPENNSYGYATILKLKELAYQNMYYENKKDTAIQQFSFLDPRVAGFATTGKMRPIILRKLEEALRNNEILRHSSRFYHEMKTFIWHLGKPQSQKGKNDDLVMSLAIGVWLWDSSPEHGKRGSALNDAMLRAFGSTSHKFSDHEGSGNDVTAATNARQPLEITTDWSTNGQKRQSLVRLRKEFGWLL